MYYLLEIKPRPKPNKESRKPEFHDQEDRYEEIEESVIVKLYQNVGSWLRPIDGSKDKTFRMIRKNLKNKAIVLTSAEDIISGHFLSVFNPFTNEFDDDITVRKSKDVEFARENNLVAYYVEFGRNTRWRR